MPEGYSARARSLIVEFSVGDIEGLGIQPGQPGHQVERPGLTRLQAMGRAGLFAQALAGYVRWLADQAERLPEYVRDQVALQRTVVRSGHARTATNVASSWWARPASWSTPAVSRR